MDVQARIDEGKYRPTLSLVGLIGLTKKARQEALEKHRKEVRETQKQFQADLAVEFEVTGHPKADLLFEKAWSKGEIDGHNGVYVLYETFVELIL